MIQSLLASCMLASPAGAGQCVRHGGTAARDEEMAPPPPWEEGYFCGTV